VEAGSVIQARSAADGGPFRTISCLRCRVRCGALRNRRGAWMLYPLEGGEEPTLLDRIVPRTSRAQFEKARRWWLVNGAAVERFRREPPDAEPQDEAPPRARAKASRPRAAKRPAAPRPVTGPRAVLGVAADATIADVRRAWRAAARRWHPDRIPTRDVVVLAEAERRFLEMRAAYDALVAELSGGRGRSK
jgi:DnaJ-like protein